MTRPNQTAAVLEFLERYGPLTHGDALLHLGVARLAARIHELRRDPELDKRIECRMIEVETRRGRKAKVAQYSIADARRA